MGLHIAKKGWIFKNRNLRNVWIEKIKKCRPYLHKTYKIVNK